MSTSSGITPRSGAALSEKPAIALWLRAAVIVGALLMAAGGVIALVHPAMLVLPSDEINGAVRIYAGYLASRNLTLAIMLLVAMTVRARPALSQLMLLTAFIQIADACIDSVEGRWVIVPGVVLFGVIFFIGAAKLSGYPFWRIGAWRPVRQRGKP